MFYEQDDGSISLKIEIVPGSITLDQNCWNCNTTGDQKSNDPNCYVCHGKGYNLTDTGETILKFLNRWYLMRCDQDLNNTR